MNLFVSILFFFLYFIDQGSAGITLGVLVAFILIGVIIFVLLYFRRRVRNLKTEIAHVQYIADPQSQPDRHHFDNPVYAFQPSTSQLMSTDAATLLNGFRPSNKNPNMERCKFDDVQRFY